MIRSTIAMIGAVLIGLTVAKFIEGVGHQAFPTPGDLDLRDPVILRENAALIPLGWKLTLLAGWGAGALAASLVVLLGAHRWAPLGWLAAATIFFLAFITMIGQPIAWWLWPGAALITMLGGFLAIKITNARYASPFAQAKEDKLF